MKLILANIITAILHPLILALVAVFLLVFKETGNIQKAFTWTFVAGFFVAIIVAFVLYGIKKKFFTNIDVSVRRQRVILYPFSVIVMIIFSVMILVANGPKALLFGIIFFIISLIILDLINTKIKASIHVAGTASLAVGVVAVFGYVAYPVLLLPFFVAWARIIEKRHTLQETAVGYLVGTFLTLGSLLIVQYLMKVY